LHTESLSKKYKFQTFLEEYNLTNSIAYLKLVITIKNLTNNLIKNYNIMNYTKKRIATNIP